MTGARAIEVMAGAPLNPTLYTLYRPRDAALLSSWAKQYPVCSVLPDLCWAMAPSTGW